ncbi:MAG: hypothetical protein JSS29_16120 [Proteobacteria bacterium]|nr:hypothetical protein [Pseudomonadota bacterium]
MKHTAALAIMVTLWMLCARASAAAPVIGVVLPQGPMVVSAAAGDALRQQIIQKLQGASLDAVPLNGATDALRDGEAQSLHCRYILYTHLAKQAGGGLRSKLSMLGGALSLGQHGNAIGNPANSAPTYAALKQGDAVELAYRLVEVGTAPDTIAPQSFASAKASSDGEDIVTPVVAQLVDAVSARAQGKGAAAPAAATPPVDGPAGGSHSPFGALFGHRSSAAAKDPSRAPGADMDCARLASMPGSVFTQDTCEKMKASQQTYAAAAADPRAQRPGDEAMSCQQIFAEMKQQPLQPVTAEQRQKAAATGQALQEATGRAVKAAHQEAVEDQAVVAAASSADNATELATAGMVRGHALQTAEKGIEARHKAVNEEVTRENTPAAQQQMAFLGDTAAQGMSEFNSNPRLARLMQLAQTRGCKGGP